MNWLPSLSLRFALLFFTLSAVSSFAALPASSFSIIDSLSLQITQKMAGQLSQNALVLRIPEHSSTWLIKQNTQRALSSKNISLRDSVATVLSIGIADCGVRYALYAERDSVIRTVRVELRYSVGEQTPVLLSSEYRDIIARSDIALVESPRYEFSSAQLPALPHSTWDEILEPLIVVAALATTVTLLFTVRSQ